MNNSQVCGIKKEETRVRLTFCSNTAWFNLTSFSSARMADKRAVVLSPEEEAAGVGHIVRGVFNLWVEAGYGSEGERIKEEDNVRRRYLYSRSSGRFGSAVFTDKWQQRINN